MAYRLEAFRECSIPCKRRWLGNVGKIVTDGWGVMVEIRTTLRRSDCEVASVGGGPEKEVAVRASECDRERRRPGAGDGRDEAGPSV